MFDLVIRNAQLLDGTGEAGIQADLAVAEGKIAAIGPELDCGQEELDAQGLVLAPGIIDSHTHYDAQLTWDSSADPSPGLGVTTAVIGNCGFTIAPCRSQDQRLTMANLAKVEGMSMAAMEVGIRWDFETFPEYLDMLEQGGLGLNIAAFCGHSSVRTWVMGADARTRAATAQEIKAMCAIITQAMAVGAIGFATSTSGSHNGDGGYPMPSRLAQDDELRALVNAMGKQGQGVFMLTKGAKTSIEFLESLAADSARPVMIAALLHNTTRPSAVFDDLDAIAAASKRGHELYGQVSCCPLSMDFSLQSPYPFEGIEAWGLALKATPRELPLILKDLNFRSAVKKDLQTPQAVRLFNGQWQNIKVVETVLAEHRTFEGKTVADLASSAQQHPLDWMLDLSLRENLKTRFVAELLNSDPKAVAKLLNHPHSAIALSDAGAHLTFFCDAGFGLHLLGYWVRDQKCMTLPAAVRRLTGQPADIYRIPKRGYLKPGYWADLMLFDPLTVGRSESQRVNDLPGGGPRLINHAIGLKGVWVNGQQVANERGRVSSGDLAGCLLREFGS